MSDNGEMIEGALGEAMAAHFNWARMDMVSVRDVADALAKQAIVIECEVEQSPHTENTTILSHSLYPGARRGWALPRIDTTPGKAIAIIVPIPEDTNE